MNLFLATISVWEFELEDTAAKTLFLGFSDLLTQSDIIAIGSYDRKQQITRWLSDRDTVSVRPYETFFKHNFDEYPDGKDFAMAATPEHLHKLAEFCSVDHGGIDKHYFFDHIVAYRLGIPILPLVDFHDAFIGGVLYLSGHYKESDIENFSKVVRCTGRMIDNPATRNNG